MPKRYSSFTDVYQIMDEALSRERGLTVQCETRGKAMSLRHRMNTARARFRERERRALELTDHSCEYDNLVFRVNDTQVELAPVSEQFGDFTLLDRATGQPLDTSNEDPNQ